jgi:hypothetical protein
MGCLLNAQISVRGRIGGDGVNPVAGRGRYTQRMPALG